MLEKAILASAIVATISIGAFVITRDFRRLMNQVYFLMTLAMLGLLIANSMTTAGSVLPLLFIRIVLMSTTVTIACLYMLVRLIIDDTSRTVRSLGTQILVLATMGVILLDLSPLVFSGVQIQQGQVIPLAAPGAVLFLLHFIVLLALSVILLLRAVSHERSQKYLQYRTFLYAIGPIMVLAPVTSFVLPVVFHQSIATEFTPLYVVYLVGMIAYAMVRHGLFDIKQAAVRSTAYVLVLATLTSIYYLAAYVFSKAFLSNTDYGISTPSILDVGLALLLAILFQPVKAFFDRVTDRLFYRETYNSEAFFALLSNVLSTTEDMKSLLERAAEVIGLTFKSRHVFFFIRYEGKHVITGTEHHTELQVHEADRLDGFTIRNKKRLIVGRNLTGDRSIQSILVKNQIEVLIPLWHEGAILGYVALGESLRSNYSSRDQRVLEAIADELVIAIQNSMSLEAVREVNANLQERVEDATRDLRSKNERLKQLDDTKDEFISMASHQLRTPLTSVKGYVSMILDGDAGPINEQQRKFLNEAFESSNRMAGIIGDFLNVSRLQTGKFTLEREDVDLSELVQSEVEHLKNTAASRGLTLRYHKPAHFPQMHLDKSKIEQVVMNFIDNAIFYAPNTGSVDIELFQRSGRAVLTVRDHGIGVPKHEQANLFTKFFRATNARSKRPDGTGVGLFLAKKVIVAHKGAIIFESEEGKGSTFGFEIPVAPY